MSGQNNFIDLSRFSSRQFDRGTSRLKEALWIVVKNLFFLTPWPWPSALRAGLLRMFGAKVGRGVVIRARVNITFPWRLELGDYVWLGEEVLILSLAQVKIASHVCISQRSFLCTGSHDFKAVTFDLKTAPIVVQTGAWIAAQCFVGPGVEIGANSLMAAGCVLTKPVPEKSFVTGNPAQIRPIEK